MSTIHSNFEQITLSGGAEVQPVTRRVVILHGLGGVGKSSIALEYSFRHSGSYTAIFWIDVTSEETLFRSARVVIEHLVTHYTRQEVSPKKVASFLQLRGLLDANGQIIAGEAEGRRLARAIKEWLSIEKNGRWLVILDNYDDISAVNIHDILPTCDAGHVIITSRRRDLQALGKTLEIEEIDEHSGVLLFLKSANREGVSGGGKYDHQLLSEQETNSES
jgi:hypothetical protein